jgi:hypothetical protein
MSTQLAVSESVDAEPEDPVGEPGNRALTIAARTAPHVLVWALLLVPTIIAMSRGWRPLADDASIAINAWNTFSHQIPLLGESTRASTGPTGLQTVANPGPLQFWLLSPFVRLDPGQGALLGSALLCAAAASTSMHVLRRTAGDAAVGVFALVMADLAVVSPTPFVDPTWNSSFAFFLFLAFMGVAFGVSRGNLRYFPLLVFFGSVTVDAHLLFLPGVACVLVGSLVSGWYFGRPKDLRWLAWTVAVVALCWSVPVLQNVFGSRPNLTLLFRSNGTATFGFVFGLRALSRAASINPIWASPRPILPFISSNDLNQRNLLLCLVLPALVIIVLVAWKRRMPSLGALSVVTLGSAIGLVALYARIPRGYFESFTWVNLALWVTGICLWLTFGVAAATFVRPLARLARSVQLSERTRHVATLAVLGSAAVAGTLVAVFPYGDQNFLQDFPGMRQAQTMVAIIESRVPRGDVGIGIRGRNASNFFQTIGEEHGATYLLRTAGWVPGMEPLDAGALHYPIHRSSPFVMFTERGTTLTRFRVYPHYVPEWGVIPLPAMTRIYGNR